MWFQRGTFSNKISYVGYYIRISLLRVDTQQNDINHSVWYVFFSKCNPLKFIFMLKNIKPVC
jgi:hypothetical protein